MSLLKILPVLALMFGPQALAQDALTKIEEGQMAISQCYSEYSQRHLEYVSVIVMGEESIGDVHFNKALTDLGEKCILSRHAVEGSHSHPQKGCSVYRPLVSGAHSAQPISAVRGAPEGI